jgi:polar amino acid transport system substrate-binding protein
MLRRLAMSLLVATIAALLSLSPSRAESTLDAVKRAGVIKVCLAQGLPDNYKEPKTGQWQGVMVDLLNELATWMKVKVEIVEVSWDVAVLSLKQNACDLIGASLVYNAPRAMEVNYIRPFGAKGINVVMRKDNAKPLHDPADMNDPSVTLVVEVGTREHEALKRLFPKAKILAVKVNSPLQVVDYVRRGDADAAALPTITVKWWLQVPENAEWGKMGFPGKDFGNAPNGWAVRYGDPDWKDFLDNYVGNVIATNRAVDLYNDYMQRTNPYLPTK